MKPTRPDPHAEVERLSLQVIEQTLLIHDLENGTAKYRWTNVGRLERQRRETARKLAEWLRVSA